MPPDPAHHAPPPNGSADAPSPGEAGPLDDPAEAKAAGLLAAAADQFGGIVPNIYRMLAVNPAVLESFMTQERLLEEGGRLSHGEHAVVAMLVAMHSECRYCQAVFAKEMAATGISAPVRRTIQKGGVPRDRRLAALVRATRRTLESHGRLGRAEIGAFERRGIAWPELLEIIGIIATYTLATYANNLARTRVDPEFAGEPEPRIGPPALAPEQDDRARKDRTP